MWLDITFLSSMTASSSISVFPYHKEYFQAIWSQMDSNIIHTNRTHLIQQAGVFCSCYRLPAGAPAVQRLAQSPQGEGSELNSVPARDPCEFFQQIISRSKNVQTRDWREGRHNTV